MPRTRRGEQVNLDRDFEACPSCAAHGDTESEFLTQAELQRRGRENLPAILQKTNWKIKGVDGAAELLGVKPTTLIKRIKRMGLTRPK